MRDYTPSPIPLWRRLGPPRPIGTYEPAALRSRAELDALWNNLADLDCTPTDHAPHTSREKGSSNPPVGVPGLETTLLLRLVLLCVSGNPYAKLRIFSRQHPLAFFGSRAKGTSRPVATPT